MLKKSIKTTSTVVVTPEKANQELLKNIEQVLSMGSPERINKSLQSLLYTYMGSPDALVSQKDNQQIRDDVFFISEIVKSIDKFSKEKHSINLN